MQNREVSRNIGNDNNMIIVGLIPRWHLGDHDNADRLPVSVVGRGAPRPCAIPGATC